MTIITMQDLRTNGICPGAKIWCEKNDVDWRTFVRDGVSVEVLRATGDNLTMIDRLEETAKKRIELSEVGKNGRG